MGNWTIDVPSFLLGCVFAILAMIAIISIALRVRTRLLSNMRAHEIECARIEAAAVIEANRKRVEQGRASEAARELTQQKALEGVF